MDVNHPSKVFIDINNKQMIERNKIMYFIKIIEK